MANSQIKYYPVGNGDTTLLNLQDGTTILVDCNIREKSKDENDETSFHVKDDLLKSIKKKNENPFIDVFILTHPDVDHCRGFESNFYQGNPDNYEEKHRKKEEIIIGELWVTSKLFKHDHADDANKVRNEANRRKKLYDDKNADSNKFGNRLIVVGYDGEEKLDNVPHYIPSNIVDTFNGIKNDLVSFFIHAPFKDDLQNAESGKNETSIAFQVRFKKSKEDNDFVGLAIFSSDSSHYIWKKILDETVSHNNEVTLKWDLFLAPHHCSWTFFNDTPQEDHPEPKQYSLKILDYKRTDKSKIIASCKEIKNNDDNPPHYQAKQQYVNKVKSDNFLHTETYKLEGKTPQPIVFEITNQGPMKPKEVEGTAKNIGSAGLGAINKPSSYGSELI
jgi:hypothetical protein